MICRDGFKMSVQASRTHACDPRDDKGPYRTVEVGYPNGVEPLLMSYQDAASIVDVCAAPPIYVRVPVRVIHEVIGVHGGMRHDSAPSPPLVELDESGYEWAAAAVPPTSSESSEGDEMRADEVPTSVVHLGAPPPPPPVTPVTPQIGALTPPQVLRNEEISTIVNIKEKDLNDSF